MLCFCFRVLMQRQDARIIVGLFYETEARKVFCEVRTFFSSIDPSRPNLTGY